MLFKAKKAALKILDKYGFSLPVDIEEIIKREGLAVQKEDLEDEVSGMLVIKEKQSIIVVNCNHHSNRQRFTMAHEFGHYILHQNLSKVFFDESLVFFRDQESSEGTRFQEIEANNFAAEILMPESILKEKIQLPLDALDESDDSVIKQLAFGFKVSVQALTIRLTKLGLITM